MTKTKLSSRPYLLTPDQKSALIKCIKREWSYRKAADEIGVTQRNIPVMISYIVCDLAEAGKIDIKKLLADY